METKYGFCSNTQIHSFILSIRKAIFFLLLYVDPKTKLEYPNVNIVDAFSGIQYKLIGFSRILKEPPQLLDVMSLLETALAEYEKGESFNFKKYRKLILDAGSKILAVEEGD